MKHLFQFLLAAALTLSLTGAATAQDALLKRAGEYLPKNGKDMAVAAFNDAKGEFIQGDLKKSATTRSAWASTNKPSAVRCAARVRCMLSEMFSSLRRR